MNSHLFFSYTRRDENFSLRLAKDLISYGVNVWMDQLNIRPGAKWDYEVEKALEASQTILVVLSPRSVKSQNILDEINYAIEENKKIIPVLMEKCLIPFRIRRLQYVDFNENYEN